MTTAACLAGVHVFQDGQVLILRYLWKSILLLFFLVSLPISLSFHHTQSPVLDF